MLELLTFSISHFCEKARWDLDRAGVAYRERVLVPGAHLVTTRRLAAESTVPILLHDGISIQGSIEIHDYIDRRLAPGALSRGTSDDDAARDWEAQLDDTLGVAGRRIAYSGGPSEAASVARLWGQAGPVWARAFLGLAFPLVMAKVRRMYETDRPDALRRALDALDRGFDQLDGALADRPYLAGNAPGRVDFAVASLLAPLRFPAEHPAPWSYTPTAVHNLRQRYARRPAFRHVEKMYRRHRHAGAPYTLARGGTRVYPPAPTRKGDGSAAESSQPSEGA